MTLGSFTLLPSRIPSHVAIIMDGNGRWAKKRGQMRISGHRAGAESVRAVVETAAKLNLQRLTLFAFSDENWVRPKVEVEAIMTLLTEYLLKERDALKKNNIRLTLIGDLSKLTTRRQQLLNETVEFLSAGTGLNLTLAVSYSGRAELARAMQKYMRACEEGTVQIKDLNPQTLQAYLDDPTMADPDLIIRTSGEIRLSNFLLWQLAYSELYFTDVLWPDFREKHFLDALHHFAGRERRFGQVKKTSNPVDVKRSQEVAIDA